MGATDDWPRSSTVLSTVDYQPTPTSDSARVEVEATVPARLAGLTLSIPSRTAALIAHAERDLQLLSDTAANHPPGTFAAITLTLTRAEALSSSRIEGIDVSNRRLSQALYDPAAANAVAREVAANTTAMQRAIELGASEPRLTIGHIAELHRILMASAAFIAEGEFRTTQNWIGPTNNPAHAEFVPPPPEHVLPTLEDMCEFSTRGDVPLIARAAIVHAQFEAIHPFPDGNGRVGRCLIAVLLRQHGGYRAIPPISAVCLADTAAYFDSLVEFQQHANPWPWIDRFAAATSAGVELARRLADDIDALRERFHEMAGRPRRGSITRRIIDAIPSMSFTDAALVAERLGVHPDVARRGLNQLEAAGVLSTIAGRRRNRVWRADEFHELLDLHLVRARRPR